MFANRNADSASRDDHDFAARSRLEVASFIKNIVGGKERLEALRDRLPVPEQCRRVKERLPAPWVAVNVSNQQRDLTN